MSDYYYLYCQKCNEYVRFVGCWFPARFGLMENADKLVPEFIAKHFKHLKQIRIIDEKEVDELQ